ncbi:MAG: nucleotide sugar dehydrogenase [Blastocatellia bacterium]|jgi:UDP-N-acetyl-D-glucosamine dehydrogenase|nr:nucleotide sugar dehydrogenase [Blastocatellia bacterium]
MGTERSTEFVERIQARTVRVGVVGLGYVGLPLAVEFASNGFDVTGFEISEEKAAEINAGSSYIQDVPTDEVRRLVDLGRLRATVDFERLTEIDAIIVCVPTPLNKTKEPDISYILSAAERIRAAMRPGQLIVLESTTYPGTTDEVLLPILAASGLELDVDFFLAFSPERVDPGNPTFQTRNITKVVGGVSEPSSLVAAALYGTVVETVHRVSSARVAEAAKLLENTFRAVNIGLVNEIAQMCYQLGIDTWEVIGAAKTKPFGFMAFYPGPGIGGHCIPLDPHYLSWKARVHGFEAKFIGLAEEVNSRMPQHVINLITEGLNRHRKAVNGSRVLVLGVAYKRDIDDVRESPALSIIDKLMDLGASVSYHDPHVPTLRLDDDHGPSPGSTRADSTMSSIDLTDEAIGQSDCVVVVTDHEGVDYAQVLRLAKLVVDTRNITSGMLTPELAAKVVRL